MEENIETVLGRWVRRFQRSMATYNEAFADETFDDLAVTLVSGALIEALLWIGIQCAGYEATGSKTLPLERLLKEASQRSVIDSAQVDQLTAFKDIRNAYAHDIDYRLTPKTLSALRDSLPADSIAALERAEANVIPAPSLGLSYRLILEQIVALTFPSIERVWNERAAAEDSVLQTTAHDCGAVTS